MKDFLTGRRWNPLDGFDKLRDDGRLSLRKSYPERKRAADRPSLPAVNVGESTNCVIVECLLPGVAKAELEVSISGNVLTIKSEKKATKAQENELAKNREVSFQRFLTLPANADAASFKATFKDGMLKVVFLKKEVNEAYSISISRQ